jgi:hypothetical protein
MLLSRIDMEEGGDIPGGFVYGRIKSLPRLMEWYITAYIFGWRIFIASGKYGGKRRGFRYHFGRQNVAA